MYGCLGGGIGGRTVLIGTLRGLAAEDNAVNGNQGENAGFADIVHTTPAYSNKGKQRGKPADVGNAKKRAEQEEPPELSSAGSAFKRGITLEAG